MMGLAEVMRQDFKNVFMAEAGEAFDVVRNGQVSHTVDALPEGNKVLKLYLDADVVVGDVLKGQLSNKKFTIKSIEFEVVERERICMTAICS